MLYIRPENNRGVLHGEITKRLEEDLQSQFVWYDINDLTNPIYFYADKVMYLGTMYDVAEFLSLRGCPCEVRLPELGPPEFDWRFEGEYRPRQEEAVEALLKDRYGVLKAAPGFGKTVVASAVACRAGRRTAFIVQSGEPFDQAFTSLRKLTNIGKVGRVSGEVRDIQPVTVYMVQTLSKEIVEDSEGEVAQAFMDSEVVMVDEVHHSAADSYLVALNALKDPKYVLGFSATPEDREDGLQPFVNAYVGRPRYEVTYGEQIEAGGLCPVTVYVMNMPERDFGYSKDRTMPAYMKRKSYQTVYQEYVIENRHRNQEGLLFAQEMIELGHSVAIIVSRIPHAEEINRMFPSAVVLTGETPKEERRRTLSKLRDKEVMCVVTTLFDEATDVPSLGAVCMLAGGKTEIRLRQRIRSTRTFSGETARGYYSKSRGYVWYPIDRTDFLRSHSQKCLKILRTIVKEHPENELIWVE